LGFFAFNSLAATGAAALAGFVANVFWAGGAFLATGFVAAFTVSAVFTAVTEAAFGALAGFAGLDGVGKGDTAEAGAEAGVEVAFMAVFE
jgi:hypothetical protein